MTKEKLWTENVRLALAEGTLDRIRMVSYTGEYRTDFLRLAVYKEVLRRARRAKRKLPSIQSLPPEVMRLLQHAARQVELEEPKPLPPAPLTPPFPGYTGSLSGSPDPDPEV